MLREKHRNADDLPGSSQATATTDKDDTAHERVVTCAACNHTLTTDKQRLERFGGHLHDRLNPAGIAFRIALYGQVDGARLSGPSSPEFAWFPHYDWRVALCGRCLSHIGWSFAESATGDAFFGLRLDAIRTSSEG